jgi:uncharacterized OsmC-like protein
VVYVKHGGEGMSDSIDGHGGPLAFKVLQGQGRSPVLADGEGRDVFKVEARHLVGHQREAVVTEGASGSAWRVTSDEGVHLKGTDLAPFPFGFFNAGLQGDLFHRIRNGAAAGGIVLDELEIHLDNEYWLTGSFALGTGQGHAEPTQVEVGLRSAVSDKVISNLVADAVAASPAMALLRTPLKDTFALYINGRRREAEGVANSIAPDARDPFAAYPSAPRPLNTGGARQDLIEKTGRRQEGAAALAPAATTTRIVRKVRGRGRLVNPAGLTKIETWLELPGMSHFVFRTDEGVSDNAPSGLALLSAGVAFCYMTQLARYIEHMKLPIRGARLVQYSPYALVTEPGGGPLTGVAGPIDTHLFLNGEAPDETHANLLMIAARTCYLHATAAASLAPRLRLVHNGTKII